MSNTPTTPPYKPSHFLSYLLRQKLSSCYQHTYLFPVIRGFQSERKQFLYPDQHTQYNLYKPQTFPWVHILLKTNLPSSDLAYTSLPVSLHLIWKHKNAFDSTYAHPLPYMNTSVKSKTHVHGLKCTHICVLTHLCTNFTIYKHICKL